MADKKKVGGGDAPPKQERRKSEEKKGRGRVVEDVEGEDVVRTESAIAREAAEYRAMMRRLRFKRKWPEVTKVKIKTVPWHPPPKPKKLPPISIDLPEVKLRKWVPPYRRRRRPRPKKARVPPEEITRPVDYDGFKLKKIWHNFVQVERNKMMLQGSIGCNSKKYSSTACGSQTACIAVMCKALLEEKPTSNLVRSDVDDTIDNGDRYYRQCLLAMKCYKGKPALELCQLLSSFYLHDTKYTIKMSEVDRGTLAKHPDVVKNEPDLMSLMEKRIGTTYTFILSVGERHFLIWGHPPSADSGTTVKTVCYMFDPHMLNEIGQPGRLYGAGAFLRYAGVVSFVSDFLANYGDLDATKKCTPKPAVVLTNIEVVQSEPLLREPLYELDLKALKTHCQSEWDSLNYNALIEKKMLHGQYPLASLSAVSLAVSRARSRRNVAEFYQRIPKEPQPTMPVQPEKPPAPLTAEQIMQFRGEGFFLYCPNSDGHSYGRDDMIPRPKSETVLHSVVDVADQNFHSQFQQIGASKWILRATRHMASYRYQKFKTYSAIACCVAALGMLRRLKARAWNEDTLDETLDVGYNLYRESLLERGGPIRSLVYGELADSFNIRDIEFGHKGRGIAVWGKLVSSNPKVLDLCRGVEAFFKESDTGILQIPGEIETAIWNEGGKYYVYHPWPADRDGRKVGIREGGKACLLFFDSISRMCDYFMDNLSDLRRKPFSIAEICVNSRPKLPKPVNNLKAVAANRWVVRGRFHEADAKFSEEHRGKQATPICMAAIAMAHLTDPADWTTDDVDETLIRGDALYQDTVEHLDRLGVSVDSPRSEEEGEEEHQGPSGTLAAVDVLNRFKVTDYDCIQSEVMDSEYSGTIQGNSKTGMISLKNSLARMFNNYSHGILTARGGSLAVWRHDDHYYMFDPHGCDENGYPSDDVRASACLVRVKGKPSRLAETVESNLSPGSDDSFNLSPVIITATKLNPAIGAPETSLESKAFEWISKGTAAIMMGPRGENSAIGKCATKAGVPADDLAGRTIALPAAAAFAAASESVPPPHMHQDHMYNFMDAGADYYLNHVRKTGRMDIQPEDLTEKFEMGANTFSIELGEPVRLPLRLPDKPVGEGEEEEEKELMEGEEEPKDEIRQIKDLLFKYWYDTTKPGSVFLLCGDYHQMALWLEPGGQLVGFDPAPTGLRGALTPQRVKKGDELRIQRLKDEMVGEGGGDEDEEEEDGAEGEQQPELVPEVVPPDSCPVLMVFASPGEFVDKLVFQGPLDSKQAIAPYKLYPVKVVNELTTSVKEKRGAAPRGEDEEADEEADDVLVEPLNDEVVGQHYSRAGRAYASVRGRVAQNENYFLDSPNRDHQDAANAVMGIVVEHVEPHIYWSPQLIDAILKYGDRLYTLSLPNAKNAPDIRPRDIVKEFHVTTFNVRLEIDQSAVEGDIKAGDTRGVLNLKRGLLQFFEGNKHGVLCAKNYCVGLWRTSDNVGYCYWDPHPIGPQGKASPGGSAGLVLISNVDDLAELIRSNIEGLARPGSNKFTISSVRVYWELSRTPDRVTPQGQVPDEGYEWKVLTAYVEVARGRTILRGSRPLDLTRFTRDAIMQSSCGAVVAAAMSLVRRPHLWTRRTLDEVMATAGQVFAASLGQLGYEFRPGEDVLLPLQVIQRFVLGVNYVRYELQEVFSGKLEQIRPSELTLRSALERFFETHSHGILWSPPLAVAVWKVQGAPSYYMMEPHATGPTGLRDDAEDDGAACVMTFTSAKLMAFAYLQNTPVTERPRHEFNLYAMAINVQPIKRMGVEPPLVRSPPGVKLVPATSKVGVDGTRRRADEESRRHPPGGATCLDAQRASAKRDRDDDKYKGQRNTSGWLVLRDGSQYLSAHHSIHCKRFSYNSRGNQAVPCCVMAIAMSRVEDVCRWTGKTLDQILDSGDQLYQDSYLHFRPDSSILGVEQVLRKFYTPGNCVCRIVVYVPRQEGAVAQDLAAKVMEFFREETSGIFVAGRGDFAVALFRTPKGFYMWDPSDRDRYGRAVAPPCRGRARGCFSQYPTVAALVEKLGANIPPTTMGPQVGIKEPSAPLATSNHSLAKSASKTSEGQASVTREPEAKMSGGQIADTKEVHFDETGEPTKFVIYGTFVSSLRRLHTHER